MGNMDWVTGAGDLLHSFDAPQKFTGIPGTCAAAFLHVQVFSRSRWTRHSEVHAALTGHGQF